MKFSIKDFFSKCDQIRSFQRIWSHLLKKSLMVNFIFCVVLNLYGPLFCGPLLGIKYYGNAAITKTIHDRPFRGCSRMGWVRSKREDGQKSVIHIPQWRYFAEYTLTKEDPKKITHKNYVRHLWSSAEIILFHRKLAIFLY